MGPWHSYIEEDKVDTDMYRGPRWAGETLLRKKASATGPGDDAS
jgi:hypothetical protein